MTKTIVIACETLSDEVLLAVNELNVSYPILWIESGLHITPDKLRKAIQDQINRLDNVENIILLFGICGIHFWGFSLLRLGLFFLKLMIVSLFSSVEIRARRSGKKRVLGIILPRVVDFILF